MTPKKINAFFEKLEALNPTPETELCYVNAFTLLVAVVLSAQTTDKGVNKATAPLFKKVKTPQAMVALGEEALREAIKTLSFYKTKAKHVIALAQILMDQHKGQVPSTREELEALPGVGRKTANVVLNVIWGLPTMAVDTHVFRVANRTGLACGKTPREVEDGLLRVIPERWMRHAHHWLILHGRFVCKARAPLCEACPVRDSCAYFESRKKTKTKGAHDI